MQHKNLIDILGRQGLARDGEAWVVPQGAQLTAYLSLDEESLIIDKVARIEIYGEVAMVVTQRRERYGCELEAIHAVRLFSEK